MALIYPDLAIVSVGMSCQTAFQIRANKPYVDRLLGAEGVLHATPFDWLICPVPAALKLLETGRFFPSARDGLARHKGRVLWPETGAYYWHEPEAIRDFDEVRAKFDHLEASWRALAGRRVLAIWSNSQTNLDSATAGMGVDYTARQSDLDRLETALRRWFPDLALYPVVAGGRVDADDPPNPGSAHPYTTEHPPLDWKGDAADWRRALHWALSRDARARSA